MRRFRDVDDYMEGLADPARAALERLRKIIRQAAPQAEEVVHYNMPAFRLGGILVWYAAFIGHIGFYPRASAIAAFKEDLAPYKTSKGAAQFLIGKAIPADLVKKMVRFRVEENQTTK